MGIGLTQLLAVRLLTDHPLQHAQLAAEGAWLETLVLPPRPRGRRRVLLTGFARFGVHERNASGELVAALLPGLDLPRFPGPQPDVVFSPELQFVAATGRVHWDDADVELVVLVLPVLWDLAAAVVLRAVEQFDPELVVMSGVAGPRQPLWIELGASNQTHPRRDASAHLQPMADARVVPGGPPALGHRAAFPSLLELGRAQLARETSLSEVMPSVELTGFPRPSNAYICNATAYTVAHALGYPDRPLTLLEGSADQRGATIHLRRDRAHVPHFFIHWPSELRGPQIEAAARVLRTIVSAQLRANENAEPLVPGEALEPTHWPTVRS